MHLHVTAWPSGKRVGHQSNQSTASIIGWNPDMTGASHCFIEQEVLHLLISTGHFQERIRNCVYKLVSSFKINLKDIDTIIVSAKYIDSYSGTF
jgi:hypothetical protein